MARLEQIANVIRSKNAGPYMLTLDVLFDNEAAFRSVMDSQAITRSSIAELYGVNAEAVRVFVVEAAQGIKISIVRPHTAGSRSDSDLYGAQQHVPLYAVEIAV